jgi:hypothetical protein
MKILVMKVPDEWGIEDIQVYHPNFDAPNFGNGNAKEAVEVKKINKEVLFPEHSWQVNGKTAPVKLYSVKGAK